MLLGGERHNMNSKFCSMRRRSGFNSNHVSAWIELTEDQEESPNNSIFG